MKRMELRAFVGVHVGAKTESEGIAHCSFWKRTDKRNRQADSEGPQLGEGSQRHSEIIPYWYSLSSNNCKWFVCRGMVAVASSFHVANRSKARVRPDGPAC